MKFLNYLFGTVLVTLICAVMFLGVPFVIIAAAHYMTSQ